MHAEHDLIDTDELAIHLVNTYENLTLTIQAILKERPKRSKVKRKFASTSSRCRGDTAEYVAKAMCINCETGYAITHDFVALAALLPEKWRDIVLSMNGGNTTRHTQQYEPFSVIGERINDVTRRVNTIFDILDQCIVPMSAKLPIDKQKFLLGSMQEGEMMILV